MSNQLLTPPEIDRDNRNDLNSPPLWSHIEADDSFWHSLAENFRARMSPDRQPALQLESKPIPVKDPLHSRPVWLGLFDQFRDIFSSRKLPPLQLESQAIAVLDPFARTRDRKSSLISIAIHTSIFAVIAFFLFHQSRKPALVAQVAPPSNLSVTPFMPFTATGPASGGGGGGGDRSVLQAKQGVLPKIAKTQIVPPDEIIRNPKPKLAVEPTVVMPQNIKLPSNMPNLGNPSTVVKGPASNGTGSGGGIGSGAGGGVGSGSGAGVGPGQGGGYGGGIYKIGGGVAPPKLVFAPDAEFSDQARMAKYQGDVPVEIIVDTHGLPHDPRVVRPIGMGLDEKALEAVKLYRFKPAVFQGHPVAVKLTVIVQFHIY